MDNIASKDALANGRVLTVPVATAAPLLAAASRAAAKSGAAVATGTVNTLPFANASFDAMLSIDVLCHQSVDPAAALAEVRRCLKPGGVLVINLPAFEWLRSDHDMRVH